MPRTLKADPKSLIVAGIFCVPLWALSAWIAFVQHKHVDAAKMASWILLLFVVLYFLLMRPKVVVTDNAIF